MFDVADNMNEFDMRKTDALWQIVIADNEGNLSDIVCTTEGAKPNPENYAQCLAVINMMFKPTPQYHMIIIKKDGEDFQRWDRERVIGSNNWREVKDLDTEKTIGCINQFSIANQEIQ